MCNITKNFFRIQDIMQKKLPMWREHPEMKEIRSPGKRDNC